MAESKPPPAGYVPYAPTPTYGRGLIEDISAELRAAPLICTQPEPWALVSSAFPVAAVVHYVKDMSHEAVRARCDEWKNGPPPSAVFGIGGGSSMDHAKFAARVLEVPLILVSSILSVDAAYTVAAGVREVQPKGAVSVVYVGDTRPTSLLIDYSIIQAAPKALNWAG